VKYTASAKTSITRFC